MTTPAQQLENITKMIALKHAEDCLTALVEEARFDAWLNAMPLCADHDYGLQLHREIFSIRASAISDTSQRELTIIAQYYPRLAVLQAALVRATATS